MTTDLGARFDPPLSASNLPLVEAEAFLAYSRIFFEAARYTNDGPALNLLERRLADFHEAEHCVAVSSGFWGLVLAARAVALPDRRVVVMPSLTYRRMADAMAWAGLEPRYCEVDTSTLTMAPERAEELIDDDVALLLGIHPMVNCCDVPGLETVAARHGLPLLIDAVESPYEVVGGRRVGSFAAPEVFSLHASKLLSGMEGGYITTQDGDLADQLRRMRAFGFNGQDNVEMLGFNAKLNEVHAAYALACLDRLEAQIPQHRVRYDTYRQALSAVPGLRLLEYDERTRPSYRQIVVELLDSWPLSRAATLAALQEIGVLARPYYSPALHQQATDPTTDQQRLPVTEKLAERFLLMPSGARTSPAHIRRLVAFLADLAREARPTLRAIPAVPHGRVPTEPPQRSKPPQAPGTDQRDPAATPQRFEATARASGRPCGETAPRAAIPVGQLYFPDWPTYSNLMRGIVARGWFTNHGPLAQELESRFARFFQVRHAIAFTSATIGLAAAAKALQLKGPVIVPAFTFPATAQALTWAGLEVRLCDVDRETHHVTPQTLAACLEGLHGRERPDAVVAVNLWGGASDVAGLEAFCRQEGLRLLFDSAQASGTRVDGVPLGGRGNVEVFSLHATKILSSGEGGVACTDDDDLAERLRNVRSSYGTQRKVAVPVTLNGRFSEAQAALGLHSLDDFQRRVEHNTAVWNIYRARLDEIPGLRMVSPANGTESNRSYVTVDVDEAEYGRTRDSLVGLLRGDNILARRYFMPGLHKVPPYQATSQRATFPATDELCRRLVQLPVGAHVTTGIAEEVLSVMERGHRKAPSLAGRW